MVGLIGMNKRSQIIGKPADSYFFIIWVCFYVANSVFGFVSKYPNSGDMFELGEMSYHCGGRCIVLTS